MERSRSRSWPNSVPLKLLLTLMLVSSFNFGKTLAQPSQLETEPRFLVTNADNQHDAAVVVKSNNAFALDLYRQLSQQEGNVCVSPYSLSLALSMTYAGARNETAAEMAKVLRFELDPARLHPALSQVAANLQTSAGPQSRRQPSLDSERS